jgi:hypothetical protein
VEVVSLADHPDLGEAFYAPELDPGPTFAYHDPVGVELWPRLDEDFAEYQGVNLMRCARSGSSCQASAGAPA